MSIDVLKLLAEVTADQPAGEDLEYDPAFGELERSAQGKPEQQFGDTIIPAEDPDWKAVKQNALDLFPRTKDLRVSSYLVRALVRTDGYEGLRDGLAVMHGLVEQYWETVHPELDPDDDNDPTLRVNVVASLCDGPAMLKGVREAPLVRSRALGSFSLRDVQVVSGQVALPEGQVPPDSASVEGAFMEAELEVLTATAEAIARSIAISQEIEDGLTARVGAAQAPSLAELRDALKEAQQALAERLTRRGVVGAGEATDAGEEGAPASAAGGTPQRIAGEIASREDVIRVLQKACDYLKRHEPTSPVPFLLERAKRLIGMNFLEIVRELAPDGLAQAKKIAGVEDEQGGW
jgi:type VI secretion system protein ImpA